MKNTHNTQKTPFTYGHNYIICKKQSQYIRVHPNSAIDVGAVDTRREIRERIFIRHVSRNVVDVVHTATHLGGMI